MKMKLQLKKRLVSGLLALTMVLGFLPTNLFPAAEAANTEVTGGGWCIDDKNAGGLKLEIDEKGKYTLTFTPSITARGVTLSYAIFPAFNPGGSNIKTDIGTEMTSDSADFSQVINESMAYIHSNAPYATNQVVEDLSSGTTITVASGTINGDLYNTLKSNFASSATESGGFEYIVVFNTSNASRLQWAYTTVAPGGVTGKDFSFVRGGASITTSHNIVNNDSKLTVNGTGEGGTFIVGGEDLENAYLTYDLSSPSGSVLINTDASGLIVEGNSTTVITTSKKATLAKGTTYYLLMKASNTISQTSNNHPITGTVTLHYEDAAANKYEETIKVLIRMQDSTYIKTTGGITITATEGTNGGDATDISVNDTLLGMSIVSGTVYLDDTSAKYKSSSSTQNYSTVTAPSVNNEITTSNLAFGLSPSGKKLTAQGGNSYTYYDTLTMSYDVVVRVNSGTPVYATMTVEIPVTIVINKAEEEETYTVTYNYNGATGGNSKTSDTYTTGGSTITLPTPTRTGYTFSGWYDGATRVGGGGDTYTTPATPRDVTLDAQWTKLYTVTFDGNIGNAPNRPATAGTSVANVPSSTDVSSGGKASWPSPTPTLRGYSFKGWSTTPTGSVVWSSGESPAITSNTTYYAQWEAKNIKFEDVVFSGKQGVTPALDSSHGPGYAEGDDHSKTDFTYTFPGGGNDYTVNDVTFSFNTNGQMIATGTLGTAVKSTFKVTARSNLNGQTKEATVTIQVPPRINGGSLNENTIQANKTVTLKEFTLSDDTKVDMSNATQLGWITQLDWYIGFGGNKDGGNNSSTLGPTMGQKLTGGSKTGITLPDESTLISGSHLWVRVVGDGDNDGGGNVDQGADQSSAAIKDAGVPYAMWVDLGEVGKERRTIQVQPVVFDLTDTKLSNVPTEIGGSVSLSQVGTGEQSELRTTNTANNYEFLGWSLTGNSPTTGVSNYKLTQTSGSDTLWTVTGEGSGFTPTGQRNNAIFKMSKLPDSTDPITVYAVYKELPSYTITVKAGTNIKQVSGGGNTDTSTLTIKVKETDVVTLSAKPSDNCVNSDYKITVTGGSTEALTGMHYVRIDTDDKSTVTLRAKANITVTFNATALADLKITGNQAYASAVVGYSVGSGSGDLGAIFTAELTNPGALAAGIEGVALYKTRNASDSDPVDFTISTTPVSLTTVAAKTATGDNAPKVEVTPKAGLSVGTYTVWLRIKENTTVDKTKRGEQQEYWQKITFVVTEKDTFDGKVTVKKDGGAWNAATVTLDPSPSVTGSQTNNETTFTGLEIDKAYTIKVTDGGKTYTTNLTLSAGNKDVTVDFVTITVKLNNGTDEASAVSGTGKKVVLRVGDTTQDVNSGNISTATASAIVLKGSPVNLSANTTSVNTGYIFDKWKADTNDVSTSASCTVVPTEATTYTAYLKKSAQVVLNYDGNYANAPDHVSNGPAIGVPMAQMVDAGSSPNVSEMIPVLGGYKFKGWSTTATKSAASWNASNTDDYAGGNSITMSSNQTLYAVWEKANITANGATATGTYGSGFSYTYAASRDDNVSGLTYTMSNLPGGLAYDANTGVIRGIPYEVGTFDVGVTAKPASDTSYRTDSFQASATLEITIQKAQPTVTSISPVGTVASGADLTSVGWEVTVVGPRYKGTPSTGASTANDWEQYTDTITYPVGQTTKSAGLGTAPVSATGSKFAATSPTNVSTAFTPGNVGTGASGTGDFDTAGKGNKQSTVWKTAAGTKDITHNGNSPKVEVSTNGTDSFQGNQSWLYAVKTSNDPAHKGYTVGAGTDGYVTLGSGTSADTVNGKRFTIKNTGTAATGTLSYTWASTNAGNSNSFEYASSPATTSLSVGGERTLDIKPKGTLDVGTYTDTLTISDGNSAAIIHVTFVVTDPKTFTGRVILKNHPIGGTLSSGAQVPSGSGLGVKIGNTAANWNSTNSSYEVTNLAVGQSYSVTITGTGGSDYTVPGVALVADVTSTTDKENEATVEVDQIATTTDPAGLSFSSGTVEGGGWYVKGQYATLKAPATGDESGKTYDFKQWKKGSDTYGGPSTNVKVEAGNVTYTAEYTLRAAGTSTVTYMDNTNTSGGNAYATFVVTNGDSHTVIGGPTRKGYVFDSWNTAMNGSGTKYSVGDTIDANTVQTNPTLYAKWEKATIGDWSDSDTGTYGVAYRYTVPFPTTTDGAGVTLTASGLPGGLSFDTNTGVISGRPYEVGTANVTITATHQYWDGSNANHYYPDSNAALTKNFTLTLEVKPYTPTLTALTATNVVNGAAYDTATYTGVVTAPLLTSKGANDVWTTTSWNVGYNPALTAGTQGTLTPGAGNFTAGNMTVAMTHTPDNTKTDANGSKYNQIYTNATGNVTASLTETYTMTVKTAPAGGTAGTAGSSATHESWAAKVNYAINGTPANGSNDTANNKVNPQTFELANTGNQSTGTLVYKWGTTGTDSSNLFEVTGQPTSLAVDGSKSFTVKPKTGLATGTYQDTLTITNEKGYAVTVKVKMAVSDPDGYTVTINTDHWSVGATSATRTNLKAGSVVLKATGGDVPLSGTNGVYTGTASYDTTYTVEVNGYTVPNLTISRMNQEATVDLYQVTVADEPSTGVSSGSKVNKEYLVDGEQVTVTIGTAASNYAFKELQDVTKSDSPVVKATGRTTASYSQSITSATAFQAVFKAVQAINGATVQVVFPASGTAAPTTPAQLSVAAVTGTVTGADTSDVTISSVKWVGLTNDNKFDTTKDTTLIVVLIPTDGDTWPFVDNDKDFTGHFKNNTDGSGLAGDPDVELSHNSGEATLTYTWPAQDRPFDSVNVKVGQLAVGATSNTTVDPADPAKYNISYHWYEKGTTTEVTTFAAETQYDLVVTFTPAEGWKFGSAFENKADKAEIDKVAKVNGGNAPEGDKTNKAEGAIGTAPATITVRYASFVPVARTIVGIEWVSGKLDTTDYYAITTTDKKTDNSDVKGTADGVYGHSDHTAKYSDIITGTLTYRLVYGTGEKSGDIAYTGSSNVEKLVYGSMPVEDSVKDMPTNGYVFTNVGTSNDQGEYDGKNVYLAYTTGSNTFYAAAPIGTLTVRELEAQRIKPSRQWTTSELTFVAGVNTFSVPSDIKASVNFNTDCNLDKEETGFAYNATQVNGKNTYYYKLDNDGNGVPETAIASGATMTTAMSGKTLYICYTDINDNEVYAPVGVLRTNGETALKVWIDNPTPGTTDPKDGATTTATTGGSSKPEYGETIRAVVDGTPTGPVSYKWYRDDGGSGWTEITGETEPTYTLTGDDIGKKIKVEITEGGTSGTVTSLNIPVGQKRTLKLDVATINKKYDGTNVNGHTYGSGDFYLYNVIDGDVVEVADYTGTKPSYAGVAVGSEITWPALDATSIASYTLGGAQGSYYRLGTQDAIAHRGQILDDGVIHVDVSFKEVPVFGQTIPSYPMGVTDLRETRPATSGTGVVSSAADFADVTKWYTGNYTAGGSNTQATGTTFGENIYTVEVKVKPVAGSSFIEGKTKFYFHFGVETYIEAVAGDGLIKNADGTWTMYHTFPAVERVRIAHVNVSVPQPVVEGTPTTSVSVIQALGTDNSPRTGDVGISNITWYEGASGTTPATSFQADGVYRVEFDLTAGNGYLYVNDTPSFVDFTVSGVGPIVGVDTKTSTGAITKVTTIATNADQEYHVVVTFGTLKGGKVPLTDVYVNAKVPATDTVIDTGYVPSVDSVKPYELTGANNVWQYWNGSTWTTITTGNKASALDASDHFLAGVPYQVIGTVKLKSASASKYVIDNNTKFYLAGIECTTTQEPVTAGSGNYAPLKDNGDGTYTLRRQFLIPVDTVITEVTTGIVNTPVPNATPDSQSDTTLAINGSGNIVTAKGLTSGGDVTATWRNETSNTAMSGGDKFDQGNVYSVEYTLTTNTGDNYTFLDETSDKVKFKVQGLEVTGVDSATKGTGDDELKVETTRISATSYKIKITFPKTTADTPIEEVTVNYTVPVEGANPAPSVNYTPMAQVTLKDDALVNNNTLNGSTWHKGNTSTGTVVTASDSFDTGDHTVFANFSAKAGYKFDSNTKFIVNGTAYTDADTNVKVAADGLSATVYHTFPGQDKIIVRVAASVRQPVAGENITANQLSSLLLAQNKDGNDMKAYVLCGNVSWSLADDPSDTQITSGTFRVGKSYKATFNIDATQYTTGYQFLNLTTDHVDFLINNVLDNGKWIDGENTTGVTANGVTVTTKAKSGHPEREYTVTVTFGPTGTTADVLTVWGNANPKVGDPISGATPTVPASEPYSAADAKWQHKEADGSWTDVTSGNFLPGHTYKAVIKAQIESDSAGKYQFTTTTAGYINDTEVGKTTVTYLDGSNAAVTTGTPVYVQVEREFVVDKVKAPVHIKSLVPNLDTNKDVATVGASVGIDTAAFPNDTNYYELTSTVTAGWYMNEDGTSAITGTDFVPGTYCLVVTVKPKDGYELSNQSGDYYWTTNGNQISSITPVVVDAATGEYRVAFRLRINEPGTSAALHVSVPIPEKGASTSSKPGISPDNTVDVDSTKWVEGSESNRGGNDVGTFTDDKTYTAIVYVKDVTVGETIYVNGEPEEVKTDDDGNMYVHYTYHIPKQTTTIINSGGGTVQLPVVTYWISDKGFTNDLTAEKMKNSGDKPTSVPNVSGKEGYTFKGWSEEDPAKLAAGKEIKLVDPKTFSITNDKTFYAVYDEPKSEHDHYAAGYPDGTFKPEQYITRAEVAAIVANACLDGFDNNANYGNPGNYSDIDPKKWYGNDVAYCTMYGVFSGYKDGTFKPDQYITRQELAVVVANMAGMQTNIGMPFTDASVISKWARDGVYTVYKNNWVSGYPDGTFRPQNNITRAETVAIFNGYLNRGVDKEGLSGLTPYVLNAAAGGYQGDGMTQYMTWTDVSEKYWAYYHIIEATNDHDFHWPNEDEKEPPEHWDAAYQDETWRYREEFTVNYVVGDHGTVPEGWVLTISVKSGGKPRTQPHVDAKDGWTFVGWAETPNGAIVEPLTVTITGAKTFYAVYAPKKTVYTVRYDAGTNGAVTGGSSESVVEGQKPIRVPDVNAHEGYTFLGWAETPAGAVTNPANATITANKTFYAVYRANQPDAQLQSHTAYMSGYADGTFRPSEAITRADVVTMVVRALGSDYDPNHVYDTSSVTDVAGHPAQNMIGYCIEKGIFSGYKDGTFLPDGTMTRQEVAVLIANLAGGAKPNQGLPFTDASSINKWARDAVYTVYSNGWLGGYKDGSFQPKNNITRAEAAVIFNNFLGRNVDKTSLEDVSEGATSPWSDVKATNWAYQNIMEATADHSFYLDDGVEHWAEP